MNLIVYWPGVCYFSINDLGHESPSAISIDGQDHS